MELRDLRRVRAAGVRAATGYAIAGARPGVHLGVPGPTVTVIVDLRGGIDLTGPGLPRLNRYRVCVDGLHSAAFHIHHVGAQRGVQLELTPDAVRAVFGMPVGELAGGPVELADLDPAAPASAMYEVAAAAGPERGADLAALLVAGAARPDEPGHRPHPDAARTWWEIARRRGNVTVGELTELSGWSARYLATHFGREYGMGLKQAARLHRFHHARLDLEAGQAAGDVAATRGYADQAHLTRDFRDFLGVPPAAYVARRAVEFAPA